MSQSAAARAHMAAYFKLEAKEKAEEIEQRTEAEFQAIFAEKIKLASVSVQTDMEHKRKEKNITKKIERSRAQSESRLKRMEMRSKIMKQVKAECYQQLEGVSKNARYGDLCKYLIVQGLMTITETRVILQCRKEDVTVVTAQIEPAIKLYQEFMRTATGITPKAAIDLDQQEFLPSGPVKGELRLACLGGVVLSAREGKIVCRNTLDSRLDLCFEALIPQIRGLLFGVRELKPSVPSEIDAAAEKIRLHILKVNQASATAAGDSKSQVPDSKLDVKVKK